MVKQSVVAPKCLHLVHQVFDCEEDAVAAILSGKINKGDVMLSDTKDQRRSGHVEMLMPTSTLRAWDWIKTLPLLRTDVFGRYQRAAIGHICPEAAAGGLIGLGRRI